MILKDIVCFFSCSLYLWTRKSSKWIQKKVVLVLPGRAKKWEHLYSFNKIFNNQKGHWKIGRRRSINLASFFFFFHEFTNRRQGTTTASHSNRAKEGLCVHTHLYNTRHKSCPSASLYTRVTLYSPYINHVKVAADYNH